MSSDEEREALARQLRSLTVPELVDVLRHVLPEHGDREGRYGVTEVLVLAKALTFDDTAPSGPGDLAVMLEVVAWPDRDHYDGGFGPEPDLFEQGACERCGIEITSTAKQAFCPACGDLCQLT